MKTALKRFSIDLRIRVGYGTAFFLLLSSFLLTLYANSELLKQVRLVDHSHKLMLEVETLFSHLKDAETGFRGYLLMNDPRFLEPYNQGRRATDSLIRVMQADRAAGITYHSNLETLKRLVEKRYDLMGQAMADYRLHPQLISDYQRVKSFFGEEITGHIRAIVREMQADEQLRLEQRLHGMDNRYRILNTITIISLGLALLMAFYGFYTYKLENRARRIADQQVAEFQRQLQDRIADLAKANKVLIQMRSIEKFASTGRIARTIAHEVRNPLTNINLAVDQLNADLRAETRGNSREGTQANTRIMLDMIGRNSVRINQLITDLLNSTKFTELVYKRISVNQLLEETLELAKDRIQLHSITVNKHYSDDICDIAVDVDRIKIAFLNIIVNAIEAMEPGKGILQIRTAGREDKCVVIITDNGPGIDKESLSKIFEPYFTSKAKGTGLGLTNTQNIILNHNGHIALESEPGKGTSFTIMLDFA